MRKKIFALIISLAMVMTMVPSMVLAKNPDRDKVSVDVTIDSIDGTQEISFGQCRFLPQLKKNLSLNLVIGLYNGTKQTVHSESDIDLEYCVDGKRWTSKEPTFTDATVGLKTITDIVDMTTNAGDNQDLFYNNLCKYLLNHSYMMRLKDEPNRVTYVAPVILPRELIVDFKNAHMGFIPNKNVKSTDILSAKFLSGYEDVLGKFNDIYDLIGKGSDDIMAEVLNLIEPALELVATKTVAVYKNDKAVAESFISKYFKLSNVPEFGINKSVQLIGNVKFDYNAVQRDLEDGNMSSSMKKFLNNYDVIPCLVSTFDIPGMQGVPVQTKDFQMNIIGRGMKAEINGVRDTEVKTLIITGMYKGFTFNLTSIANYLINSKALISYSGDYAKISAKDMVKTYHVGKSKKLNKNKQFKYSASTDYGYLTFTKMSGNKRISIDKYSGKVTVKKGLKRGKTYKLKVLLRAAGRSTTKTVKIKIAK